MKNTRKIALVLTAALALAGCGNTGEGEKNGVITRIAQTGMFCKTWEADIIRGGLDQGTGVMGQSFSVTIEDPKLLTTMQTAFQKGQEVRIRYRTELVSFCRSDSQDNFVTAVELVGPGQGGVVKEGAKPTAAAPKALNSTGTTMTPGQVDRLLDQHQQMIDLLKATRQAK